MGSREIVGDITGEVRMWEGSGLEVLRCEEVEDNDARAAVDEGTGRLLERESRRLEALVGRERELEALVEIEREGRRLEALVEREREGRKLEALVEREKEGRGFEALVERERECRGLEVG